MDLKKLFLALGLLLLVGVWGACVDVPNGPGTIINPDFHSLARFVHAVPGAAAGDVKVDGATIGNTTFGNATGYADILSGTRSVTFGTEAAQNLSFGSEQQSTFALYRDAAGALTYINLVEGHTDKNNGKPGKVKVKFVNLAVGSDNITFRQDSPAGGDLRAGVQFANASQYTEIDTPRSRAIYALSSGSYLVTSIKNANQIPPVPPARSNLTKGDATASLVVDSLTYNISLVTDNRAGIYTADNIHNGASGVAGPVLYPVSTDSQNVKFSNPVTLSGGNEPPPVTTASTGTGRFNFNSKRGFDYNLSITRDNSLGWFIAAHFHAGPAGVNGPVVFPLTIPKQSIAFPVDSLRGRNEPAPADTNSKAGGLGTFTLYQDSLVYSITVARRTETADTTFAAMHFHNAAAGVNGSIVKDLATAVLGNAPWSNTSKTFTGTWKRTDTQPLTDALIAELIAGRIYLNAHTLVRPGGAIRSQLKNVPTSTFSFTGNWNDATLTPVLKDTIAKGGLYVNFHTALQPNGQIRAQCIPDTFTTNTFRGVWNIPRDSTRIKEEFNRERMYFNFHTLTNPDGDVRGQLTLDPSKGQYGTAKINAAAYEDGKMYTVIAVGKGATFQLFRLEDRRAGVAKPVFAPKATTSVQAKNN